MNTDILQPDQLELLKDRVMRSAGQLKNEMIGMAVLGSIISIIGGLYTIKMVIRPLKKLVRFAEENGNGTDICKTALHPSQFSSLP